jgi:hypothetical protein
MAGTYVYVTTVLLMGPLVVLLSVLRPLLLLTPPELVPPEPARTFDLIFICVFPKGPCRLHGVIAGPIAGKFNGRPMQHRPTAKGQLVELRSARNGSARSQAQRAARKRAEADSKAKVQKFIVGFLVLS